MLATLLVMAAGAAGTVDVYLVRDQDTEPCDEGCWKSLEKHAKAKPGVRKVQLEEEAAKVTVAAQGLKVPRLLSGLEGFKAEMRAGYAGAEVRVEPETFFPPIIRPEAEMVVLPLSAELKAAIEQATGVTLQQRMKCVGQLQTPLSGEVFLARFQQEGLVPRVYLPFVATPDFDGDGAPDLYLKLSGLPEIVVLGKAGALHVFTVGKRDPDEMIRCDLTPDHFVRVVKKKNVRCEESGERPKGDAVERMAWNQSSDLFFFDGTKFTSCKPQGSKGPEVEQGFEKADKNIKLFKHGNEEKKQ